MRLLLNPTDWTKLLTGAALGAFGFVATYVTEFITGSPIPPEFKPALVTLFSVVANYVRKVMSAEQS